MKPTHILYSGKNIYFLSDIKSAARNSQFTAVSKRVVNSFGEIVDEVARPGGLFNIDPNMILVAIHNPLIPLKVEHTEIRLVPVDR